MIFVIYECEERLGYSFKDKTLLRNCFTHSSYSHEHGGKNNERLEFFGDSILGFIVTEYLYGKFPEEEEGRLTLYKQQIVSGKPLAEAIIRLGLNDFILYGEGERKNSPEHHEAACENLFEALVAGIYIDGGLEEAKSFIKKALLSRFRPDRKIATGAEAKPSQNAKIENYKGKLQEYVQKNKLGEIVYREKKKTGPAHDPVFTVSAEVSGKVLAVASGKKKSEAEQSAAKIALSKLGGGNDEVSQKRNGQKQNSQKQNDKTQNARKQNDGQKNKRQNDRKKSGNEQNRQNKRNKPQADKKQGKVVFENKLKTNKIRSDNKNRVKAKKPKPRKGERLSEF